MTPEIKKQKLAFAGALIRQQIAALPSEQRRVHQQQIEEYVIALRSWEAGKVGATYPQPQAIMQLCKRYAAAEGPTKVKPSVIRNVLRDLEKHPSEPDLRSSDKVSLYGVELP